MKRFNDELKFNGTRYCAKLPNRQHHEIVPDDFQNSKTQFVQLLNKLNTELLATIKLSKLLKHTKNKRFLKK